MCALWVITYVCRLLSKNLLLNIGDKLLDIRNLSHLVCLNIFGICCPTKMLT